MLLRGLSFCSSIISGFDHRSHLPYPDFSNSLIWQESSKKVMRALRLCSLTPIKGETEKVSSKAQSLGCDHKLYFGSLAEDGFSYKERFIVRFHEIGFNGATTIQSIANFLQEVGCNHFLSIGFSTQDGFSTSPTMREFGLIWVTSRMHIELYKYPLWNDVIEIETWGLCEGSHSTIRREWIITDYATGQVIGRATSKWLLLNRETRRLQKAPKPVLEEILKYTPKQPRLAFPAATNEGLKKMEKLNEPAQYSKLGLMARRADLDMNHHVNNVTYIGWLLESVPRHVHLSHELQSLSIDYKHECGYDDVIDSFTSHGALVNSPSSDCGHGRIIAYSQDDETDGLLQFRHLLRLSRKGSETNRGRSKWRKKKPSQL